MKMKIKIQNKCYTAETVVRETFVALNAYLENWKSLKIKILVLTSRN